MNKQEFDYYWYLYQKTEDYVAKTALKKYGKKNWAVDVEGSSGVGDHTKWEVSLYNKKGDRTIVEIGIKELFE